MDGTERVSRRRRWTDDLGVEWVRRGEAVAPRRAERLILDPGARVLRFGRSSVVEVPADEREAYWRRIGPYVRGQVRREVGQPTDDHVDCEVAEFRDAQRRVTIVVHEAC